jgi:hypothetical protein
MPFPRCLCCLQVLMSGLAGMSAAPSAAPQLLAATSTALAAAGLPMPLPLLIPNVVPFGAPAPAAHLAAPAARLAAPAAAAATVAPAAAVPFLAAERQPVGAVQQAACWYQQVAVPLTLSALAGNVQLPDLLSAAEALCGVQVHVLDTATRRVTLCVVGAPAAAAMARHMILSAGVS